MFKRLDEKDVIALRIPFESERQSPSSLGTIFLIVVPLNILLFMLIYFVLGKETVLPKQDLVFKFHLGITIFISIFSLLFSIPSIYMRWQKLQYLLSIIMSQIFFTFKFFILTLCVAGIGKGILVNEATLKK